MLLLKNALITVSLGAALVVPNVALASTTSSSNSHQVASSNHSDKHDSDDKSKKVESKDNDNHKSSKPKVETKEQDKHNHKGDDQEDKAKVCPPKSAPTPKPVHGTTSVKPLVLGKGNADTGKVLAATVAPVAVKSASTLPVTGAGTDISLAVAAATALAAYQLAKRRRA